MKREREFEAKSLLTATAFKQLSRDLKTAHRAKRSHLRSYYFDTSTQTFKNNRSALRLRTNGDRFVITAKIRVNDFHQELTLPLTPAEFQKVTTEECLVVPQELRQALTEYGIQLNADEPLPLVVAFETERDEVQITSDILIALDRTFNAHFQDYEIEVESPGTSQSEDYLKSLLESRDLPFTPALPKIARAIAAAEQ